jgi:Holliday junction resolvasome RuvABC endonuclease subunit
MPAPDHILCLDLALANTGVAVLSLGEPDRLVAVDVIRTEAGSGKARVSDDDWRRTSELVLGLEHAIGRWEPVHIFIECPTGGSKSAKAAKSMALSRGAACGAITLLGIGCTLVTPFEAKRAATGDANATKDQVRDSVLARFPYFNGWIKGKGGKLLRGVNEHAYDAVSVYMAATATRKYKELRK